MYQLLDIFFFGFHTIWIVFNLVGWMWEKTRKLNLLTLMLTAFSWVVLGIWYGFGYCPCTHWHWLVRRKLGDGNLPNSYIKFLISKLTGLDIPAVWVDAGTLLLFITAFGLSIYVNTRGEKG